MGRLFHPTADEQWGKPSHAIHIQPHLSSEARNGLAKVQAVAAGEWPGALHCVPRDAIHVTIYPLVRVPGVFDREAYWRAIETPSRALLREAAAGARAFDLRFVRLKATREAIIAIAEDQSGLIAAIRRRIVETIPPPEGFEPIRYDLIHATLARFASSKPVPIAAVERLDALTVSASARVERLKLTRESRFPCLVAEEIGSVSIGPDPQ